MWLPLTLLVLAGTVSADYQHGWKVGNEYTYLVRSRTLTSLEQLSDQYTGILIKAMLTVQVKDQQTLAANLINSQYARIHKSLPDGWESQISDQMLELRDLPMSGKPFEIKLKHGVIKDLIVERDIPTWEVNMLKSIVSQLQVDSQGENIIKTKDVQVPNDEEPYGSFRTMEDSVGGKCEVLYDITPLSDHVIDMRPELVPLPELKGDGQHIDIMKTKDFKKCVQRMNYHFGITGSNNWEPGSNDNGKFLSKSSMSRIIISGNLKSFTIQSSVTTSKMLISPRFYDYQNGMVASKLNLTLGKVDKIRRRLPTLKSPESTGNLVYVYNNPFSDIEERRINKNLENSKQVMTSDSLRSVSSSEEMKKKGVDGLRSVASATTSASSSSISSSEENTFWQPKPTLEDAPQNPLMPNFIGNENKVIGKSDKIDVKKAVNDLIFQIANEMDDPSSMPVQDTLDKFTILCSLIRTMSLKDINQFQNMLHISPYESNFYKNSDKSQVIKQNAWAVFRDAIAHAGTGPAFLTIRNWIEKGEISVSEAADILSRLPRTARTPTDDYVRSLFELATSSKVMQEIDLSNSAILAFADLLRYSQVHNRSLHNLYPVHTFGRLTSKHDKTLVDKYIPYLAGQLKKAVDDRDSRRIQTYIVALGKIGHPKILTVFEPYLEGKKPLTVFQRTLMVATLGSLAENSPKLARSVLYKIYLNTAENHEVRCTAVFLLMKTNPPLNMLQRMAEFTNIDTNKHVNSAVKSTIQSLVDLTSPEYQDLARKARTASGLLTADEYNYQYSHGFISDTVIPTKNMISQRIFNYIGSDDSMIPRIMYLGWFSSYGDFKIQPTELMAMISSIATLQRVKFDNNEELSSIKLATEEIAEQLKIIPDRLVPLEGNLQLKSIFSSWFYSFDKQSLQSLITEYITSGKNNGFTNMNKLSSYDVTLGFPTETGLPFVYTFKVLNLKKLNGDGQLNMAPRVEFSAKYKVRAVYARKIQGRVGFVTPFEHQHFIAGVDVNFQAFAPVKVDLNLNIMKRNLQLKVWPLKGEEKARLIHYKVIPYTSNRDILSLRPVIKEQNTHMAITDDIKSFTLPREGKKIMKLDVEADKSDTDFWRIGFDNIWEKIMIPWTLDSDKYRNVDLSLNLEQQQVDPVEFIVAFDTMDMKPEATNSAEWTSTAKAVEPSNKGRDSTDRRMQFLKEAAKGVKSPRLGVVDVQLETPGEWGMRNVFTYAWSDSNMDSRERTLFYLHFELPRENSKLEVCTAIQSKTTPESLFPYGEAIKTQPKSEFDADVRFGESCSNGEQMNINGVGVQTDRLRKSLEDDALMKLCQEQMQQGNKILKACQNAAAKLMILDQVNVSVNNVPEKLQGLTDILLTVLGNMEYVNAQMDTTKVKNAGKKKIDIKTELSDDLNIAKLTIHAPSMDLHMNKIELSMLGLDADDILVAGDKDMDMSNIAYNEYEPTCVLDRTRAQTFDGKEYPLSLGNCWHAVMTTYPKLDREDLKVPTPEVDSVSVLSRDIEHGKREVMIKLGVYDIRLKPHHDQIQVTVNGEKVQVDKDKSYQQRKDKSVVFEIFRLGQDAVGLDSEVYGVKLSFDGKRVSIKVDDKYRNSVRGLCGNFDGDVINDFNSPMNCMLRKPNQFVASYALTKTECEDDVVRIHEMINRTECVRHMSNRPSNVINDVESGRTANEWDNWGYNHGKKTNGARCSTHRTKIIESDDKICFSMRPILSCINGCSPTETVPKNHQFHCMNRNDAALNLQRRIEKGANPDLTQKTVSMSHPYNVPLACMA
ncbi:Vg [Anthophora quadrimaculata]